MIFNFRLSIHFFFTLGITKALISSWLVLLGLLSFKYYLFYFMVLACLFMKRRREILHGHQKVFLHL